MKYLLVEITVLLALIPIARASVYGPLPEPEYADTEVTTNVVFSVNREWRSAVMTIGASLAV